MIAAAEDEQMSQALCERLFAHIGQFRAEATKHFRKIVENMHLPDFGNHFDINSIKITKEEAILFDEHDERLYQQDSHKSGEPHLLNFDMSEFNTFEHNSIYYKITNQNEQLSLCQSQKGAVPSLDSYTKVCQACGVVFELDANSLNR